MVRILVFGAGAIGQWVATYMAAGGADVTVLCRHTIREAIAANGLRVRQAPSGQLEATVRAVETLSELPADHFDWIFITVKAFDVENALSELAAAGVLGGQARVMGFQNGVGTEEMVARAVAPERSSVCSVTRVIALTDRAGEVLEAKPVGGIAVAHFDRPAALEEPSFGELDAVFARSGLVVSRFHDYRVMKWSKLLLNTTANATCAIVDCTPSEVYASRGLFAVEHAAFKETMAVMRAMGIAPIDLPGYPATRLCFVMSNMPRRLARYLVAYGVGHGRGSKQPSLRLEMDRGRTRSEIGWLNGAVVEHARRLGLTAPTHAFLTSTLQEILGGRVPWETYRGKPDRFLADYAEWLAAVPT